MQLHTQRVVECNLWNVIGAMHMHVCSLMLCCNCCVLFGVMWVMLAVYVCMRVHVLYIYVLDKIDVVAFSEVRDLINEMYVPYYAEPCCNARHVCLHMCTFIICLLYTAMQCNAFMYGVFGNAMSSCYYIMYYTDVGCAYRYVGLLVCSYVCI